MECAQNAKTTPTSYSVQVAFVQFENPAEQEKRLETVPPTGWGTTSTPATTSEIDFVASFLLILGVFYVFPWFFGSFFYFSSSKPAYLVGILCSILFLISVFVSMVMFCTLGYLYHPWIGLLW